MGECMRIIPRPTRPTPIARVGAIKLHAFKVYLCVALAGRCRLHEVRTVGSIGGPPIVC